MIRQQDMETLGKAKNSLVVSLYLNLSGTKLDIKAHQLTLRDMIRDQKHFFKQFHKKNFKLAEKELNRVYEFAAHDLTKNHHQGLVVFSSQGSHLWMVQTLPQPIRNLLVVDNTPYIRPLISYFNRHRPLGVVHIDRKEAHFFKVFLGEIHEIGRIKDEVPRRVRAGGWQGYEEKKIDRHVQDRIAHHFQNTAQTLLPLFKKEELEGLVLIGNKKNVSEFKSFLHPYLKERHLADLELDRLPKEKEILKEVLKLEGRQELARQKPVFEKWVEGVEKKSMAVGGLRQTLHALNQGIVRVLFVGDTCRAQGKRCNACNELRVDGSLCSQCQELLDSVPDVVDEAEQLAVQQDIEIYSVHANAQLERYGGIGALLRYHNKS